MKRILIIAALFIVVLSLIHAVLGNVILFHGFVIYPYLY
jgi:hypothetical protein